MPLFVTPRQLTQRAELYRQLAQLTSAGIGVIQALEQIKRNPPARSFREPLQRLIGEIGEGRTLTESFRMLAWLPDFDLALIEAGEQCGRLDTCFHSLANYYEERARIIKEVIAHLVYPVGLIHLAVFIFLIVLPFAGSQFSASLPLLFAKAVLILAPFYFGIALMIYVLQNKHNENWRAWVESVLRVVPLLGSARHHLALARLAAALEALNSAGVNIIEAWNLAATASGSPALRRAVAAWKPQLAAGQTHAEILRRCPQFPETFVNLYASGEVSGKLDDSLARLHQYYTEEGTRQMNAFARWAPRLLYFLVALIIAWKIIGFFTSYFNQISSVTSGF
jgi:type II secretory pathway component PulF